MKKMITALAALLSLLMLTAGATLATDDEFVCIAKKVEGGVATFKCKVKDAKGIEIGVKYGLKKKFEGC